MASYYYLVASLPALRYGGVLPFSTEAFLVQCKTQVSPHHYQLLETALAGTPSTQHFLNSYQNFAQMVKKELTEQRSRKLGLNDPSYRNDADKEARISESVRQALASDDVLQAEMMLIALHWKFLDDLSALHVFDIEGLLAYALKLAILERKSLFTQEEGNAEFKRLFSNIQSQIENS